ncbi:thiol:disulfide interchange protein [Pedobacter cryoconitis]|uniref:Thiol:disulfide interchange protein n=1 Tax=Pedobacter cryoconitis TaxID=188932 RepID=A0A7W9DK54_9SPHI|nr:thioredoxin fold domain-containing protein [Pedobacter cryoconitis]MBB5621877.1 thiol:disulfide interchange protein [Pedobacter cryoconitis]
MKNQLLKSGILALCITLLSGLYASHALAQKKGKPQEIEFSQQSYKQVMATAKKTHKQVFIDAYAVWCSPCKELRKTTFKDAKTAAYFNKNFINFSVDVEKGDGVELAKTWQVEGLPTLLIIDENGKVLANHTGFVDGNGLMQFAQEAINSIQ